MINYIYTLSDPRDSRIRYVGKTDNLKKRYGKHCSVQNRKDHRANWLNQLRSLDLKPVMSVIEKCDDTTWAERETYWIAYYRESGCDLVNTTDGGDGVVGYIPSEETRRKVSKIHKGKILSEETKRKIGEANKGKIRNEETRRKTSESNKRRIVSEETKRKMSEANSGENNPNFGKTPSEETKRKMSEAHKGKTRSEEHKRKLSESAKLYHQRVREENQCG